MIRAFIFPDDSIPKSIFDAMKNNKNVCINRHIVAIKFGDTSIVLPKHKNLLAKFMNAHDNFIVFHVSYSSDDKRCLSIEVESDIRSLLSRFGFVRHLEHDINEYLFCHKSLDCEDFFHVYHYGDYDPDSRLAMFVESDSMHIYRERIFEEEEDEIHITPRCLFE